MINENDIEYYEEVPDGYIELTNLMELFRLKQGTTEKTIENMEIRTDLRLILYNPVTMQYYNRYLHYSTNRMQMQTYFNDKNLYINKGDLLWS